MSLCSRVVVVLCALLFGCSSLDAGPESDTASAPVAMLRITSEQVKDLLPGDVTILEVRYLAADGTPLAGRSIEFGLSETTSGASLSPAQVVSDSYGNAQSELRAGTSKATFEVHVSAEGVEPVSFQIRVGDALAPTATVRVSYPGKRDAASYSLTLVRGMDCDNIAIIGPGVNVASHVIYEREESVSFDLGAGLSYAVVAWAKDDTNAKLASGCKEITAPTTADPDDAHLDLVVPLADVSLALGDRYAVTLSLNLEKPLGNLANSAIDAVSEVLPRNATRAATFYLDAVQAGLPELAQLRQATSPLPQLDQALQLQLDASQSGPLRFAGELASLVSALGPSCSVQASYEDGGVGTFSVARLLALPSAALGATAKDVALGSGALTGDAVLNASYDEAAAALVVDALSLEIGLGSYANVLLDAARADPQAGVIPRLAAAHGCAHVGSLVSSRGSPGISAAATAACEQAVAGLIDRIGAGWTALDADFPMIWLSGALPVHDRDDDGLVDDLGPAELSGSWGTAASAVPADGVGATLRVPAPTALVAL